MTNTFKNFYEILKRVKNIPARALLEDVDGIVAALACAEGDRVEDGMELVTLEA